MTIRAPRIVDAVRAAIESGHDDNWSWLLDDEYTCYAHRDNVHRTRDTRDLAIMELAEKHGRRWQVRYVDTLEALL